MGVQLLWARQPNQSLFLRKLRDASMTWKNDDCVLVFDWTCKCGTENRDDFGEYPPRTFPDETLPCKNCGARFVLPQPSIEIIQSLPEQVK
jgi:hypothetical protein